MGNGKIPKKNFRSHLPFFKKLKSYFKNGFIVLSDFIFPSYFIYPLEKKNVSSGTNIN